MDGLDDLRTFSEIINRREAEMDLAEAALLIGRYEYADLDVPFYLQRLQAMGRAAAARVLASDPPRETVAKINRYLFDEVGLRGNEEDYLDPKNSFLNEVLERKVGIPITLSIIYLTVAGSIPFPLQGVGFPGHFLIRYVSDREELIIDPFHKGAILAIPDCQDLLDHVYEGAVEFRPEFLRPVTKRQIIQRVLNNLKGTYVRLELHTQALAIVERLLCLDPNAPEEIRDRGVLHYQLKNYGKALLDLERYLRLTPHAQDRESAEENIRLLRRLLASMN